MNYITYSTLTKEILSWGACDEPQYFVSDGVGVLEDVEATSHTHCVDAGALVAYTEGQAAAKAAVPYYPSHWDNITFSWVDERELPEAKDQQWGLVKAARDAVISGGITWDGSVFDSDPIAQGRIAGAATLALMAVVAGQAGAFNKTWKLADNSTRMLSASDMMAVGVALGQMVQEQIDKGEVLRLQIYASTTLDQVKGIVWQS